METKSKFDLSSDSSSLLAYALNDGTVGMYNDGIRLWRIKVENIKTIFIDLKFK